MELNVTQLRKSSNEIRQANKKALKERMAHKKEPME